MFDILLNICELQFFNPFLTYNEYFATLLWLTPNDFTRQGRPSIAKVLKAIKLTFPD